MRVVVMFGGRKGGVVVSDARLFFLCEYIGLHRHGTKYTV